MAVIRGERVRLRTVTDEDLRALHEIAQKPEVARWWGVQEDPRWPLSDDARSFAIIFDFEIAGLIQVYEEEDPAYRHAGIDVLVDPDQHGQGIGTDAVRTLARHLIEREGHHRVVIDPAVTNTVAIRCYEKVGFKPVGVMRRYERDPDGSGWHDNLLMDLLPEDFQD